VDFETEESYNDKKKKLSRENNLNDYLRVLTCKFEIPGCMFNEVDKEGVEEEQEEANLQAEFAKLPMNRKKNIQQIKQFKSIIDTKRKLYNSGLPKKVWIELPHYG
jgi:hypothetical protein